MSHVCQVITLSALRRLRPSHKNPYLRYIVAGYHAEHSHKALDATSRKLLLFMWEAVPSPDIAEHSILCIMVFVRMCLVDNEPAARFLLALRAGKEFATAAHEALDQLGVTHPSAYLTWGRGVTAEEYDANRRRTLMLTLTLVQRHTHACTYTSNEMDLFRYVLILKARTE